MIPAMTKPVSLREVVEYLDFIDEETPGFIDPQDGEIHVLDRIQAGESAEEKAFAQDWRHLPGAFDLNESVIARQFIRSLPTGSAQEEMADAFRGPGAWRWFKSALARHGLRDQWYAFRQQGVERFAREWLVEEGLAYVDDLTPPATA